MSEIKIAHITTIDASVRYLLLNQLGTMQHGGYDVAAISAPGPDVPAIEAAGIKHLPVYMSRNFSPLIDLRSLWQLYRLMRREQFTIVHTHTPKAGLLGQLAARLARVPIVVNTLHGFYFHDHMSARARRFYIAMERIAARCSSSILSQNSEDIATALRERICKPDLIQHLGNGIDLSSFNPQCFTQAEVATCKEQLGIAASAPVIGFVGRLAAKRKGFLDFLAAAQRVAEIVPDARFLIIGEADHGKPDAVEPSTAAAYGIADRCIFLGQQPNDQLPLLYKTMTLLVLPSLFEGVPRVVMEAAAMGVPAVVTDVKGNREVVDQRCNGLRVPLGDVAALATAMLELVTQPELAAGMGREALRIAVERFDERHVFAKVLAEYGRLLQSNGLVPSVSGASKPVHKLYEPLKRAVDLAVALPALLVLAPVILVVALLVRLKLGSPILFRQTRPGFQAKPFTMYKFRTMRDVRDAHGNLLPDAARLPAIGRFLRSTSLDELPELINVLKGEMSLVGPRPLLTHYLERYTPEQMRRHEVPPGITGWAQVNGRNALSWEQKFTLDVWYIDHQSLWLDLKIICLTLWKIFKREGISQAGHATMEEFRGSKT